MTSRDSLILASLLMTTTAMAQPTIDISNNQPISGQEFVLRNNASWNWEGPSGANVMFAFWDLFSTGNRNYRVYDASISSSAVATAPSANMLTTDGGTDTLFWNYAADGLYELGGRTGLEGLYAYSDPILELKYPCTFGTTWSDIALANYNTPFGAAQRTGTITGSADAYGDLGVSQAFYPNVLRVKVRRAFTDVAAIATVQRISTTYYFYSEFIPWPVLKLVEDSVIINGGAPSVAKSSQWLGGPGGVGLSEINANDIVFTPYPNPTNGTLDLRLENLLEVRSIEVINANGQLVQQVTKPLSGTVSGVLDMTGLAAGVYQVRITRADGGQGTRRVLVQ